MKLGILEKGDAILNISAITNFSCSFSEDGKYLATAMSASPYVDIYKKTDEKFIKLTSLTGITGQAMHCAFSKDGMYLSVCHINSPYVSIYKRNGDTFTKLTNPSSLPPNNALRSEFSNDGNYLAVSFANTSPFIYIYKRNGDVFTKLNNPSTLPTGSIWDVSFSPDDSMLAVAHSNSPFLTVYSRNGDTFTKLANPTILPPNSATNSIATTARFSKDGKKLLVITNTSPFLIVYAVNGQTFTPIPNTPSIIAGSSYSRAAFSDDSSILAVAGSQAPYVQFYEIKNNEFTIMENPSNMSNNVAYGVSISKDGYICYALANSPFLKMYKIENIYDHQFLISSEDKYCSYFSEGSLNENAVPKLTSNIGSNGVAFSSNTTTGTGLNAYEVFDGNEATRWGNSNVNAVPSWVGYQFNIPRKVLKYVINCPNSTYYPVNFEFQGSNDGNNYDSLHSVTSNTYGKKEFQINNNSHYKYYRLYITRISSGTTLPAIAELEMYAEPIKRFKVISEVTEKEYIEHGMNSENFMDLHEGIEEIEYIIVSSIPLSSGKVFKQKIDTSKTPIKKVSIT